MNEPQILEAQGARFRETIQEWLNETEEIAVQRDNLHVSQQFVVNAVDQAQKLVQRRSVRDWIHLIRRKPFQIRGVVDHTFISCFAAGMQSENSFVVLESVYYPKLVRDVRGSGTGNSVVALVLGHYLGRYAWIGEPILVPALDNVSNDDAAEYVWARLEGTPRRPWWKLCRLSHCLETRASNAASPAQASAHVLRV